MVYSLNIYQVTLGLVALNGKNKAALEYSYMELLTRALTNPLNLEELSPRDVRQSSSSYIDYECYRASQYNAPCKRDSGSIYPTQDGRRGRGGSTKAY